MLPNTEMLGVHHEITDLPAQPAAPLDRVGSLAASHAITCPPGFEENTPAEALPTLDDLTGATVVEAHTGDDQPREEAAGVSDPSDAEEHSEPPRNSDGPNEPPDEPPNEPPADGFATPEDPDEGSDRDSGDDPALRFAADMVGRQRPGRPVDIEKLAALLKSLDENRAAFAAENAVAAREVGRDDTNVVQGRFPKIEPPDITEQESQGGKLAEVTSLPEPPHQIPTDVSREERWLQQNEKAAAILPVVERVRIDSLGKERIIADTDGVFAPAHGDDILTSLRAAGAAAGEAAHGAITHRYLDIGSGDGRWVFLAGAALGMEAHGVEQSPERFQASVEALEALHREGVITPRDAANIHLHQQDFFNMDISGYDIFSFYEGSGPSLGQVEEKLLADAGPGARLIVYNARMTHPGSLMPATLRLPGVGLPVNIYVVPPRLR